MPFSKPPDDKLWIEFAWPCKALLQGAYKQYTVHDVQLHAVIVFLVIRLENGRCNSAPAASSSCCLLKKKQRESVIAQRWGAHEFIKESQTPCKFIIGIYIWMCIHRWENSLQIAALQNSPKLLYLRVTCVTILKYRQCGQKGCVGRDKLGIKFAWLSSNVWCTFQRILITWGTGCNILHVSRWLVVMLSHNAFISLGSQTLVCIHGNISWVLLQLSWRIAVVFHRAIASERSNVLNNKMNMQRFNVMWNLMCTPTLVHWPHPPRACIGWD